MRSSILLKKMHTSEACPNSMTAPWMCLSYIAIYDSNNTSSSKTVCAMQDHLC